MRQPRLPPQQDDFPEAKSMSFETLLPKPLRHMRQFSDGFYNLASAERACRISKQDVGCGNPVGPGVRVDELNQISVVTGQMSNFCKSV